jgi:hypothetical protein
MAISDAGVERYKDQSLTVDNNGAYDYAADTRGYTYGACWNIRAEGLWVPWVERR